MEKKKIKIEIKNLWTGKVLFEYEKEDNTVKDTLIEAVKKDAYLRGAELRGADLRGADLRDAYLRGADLRGADLRGADLRDAYLRGADLRGAYLRDAYLRGADLRGAKNVPFIPMVCPSDGAFTGWKKVRDGDYDFLVKLMIPEDAKRYSSTGRKCRCSKAVVMEITDLDEMERKVESCTNHSYNQETVYKVGEEVLPDSFDENRWNECSHGIHFFINRQEAIDYDV